MISAKRFDSEFLDIMKEVAQAQGVTIENLIEAWCIRRLAKDQAEIRVWGKVSEPMLETARHGEHTLRGIDLYQWLLAYYEQKKEKEFVTELEESKLQYGIPLEEHEKEIVERVRPDLLKEQKPLRTREQRRAEWEEKHPGVPPPKVYWEEDEEGTREG